MTPRFAVDVAESIQGTRADVGETAHCAGCDARMHEGHPITVVARHRSSGWDFEVVFGPSVRPRISASTSLGPVRPSRWWKASLGS
jgi:hypothetical protein